MRNIFAGLITVFMLTSITGCGSRIDAFYETLDYALSNDNDVTLSQSELEALTYPANYARVNDGPRVVVGLGFDLHGDYHWLSQSGQALITRNGRIVKTEGLEHDIELLTNQSETDPLECLTGRSSGCKLQWHAKWQLGEGLLSNTIDIASGFRLVSERTLTLPSGEEVNVEHWEEVFSLGDERIVNTFDIDKETRRVVRSSQQIGQDNSAITLSMSELKPYQKDLRTAECEQSKTSDEKHLESSATDSLDNKVQVSVKVYKGTGDVASFRFGYQSPQRLTTVYQDALERLTSKERSLVLHNYSRIGTQALQQALDKRKQSVAQQLSQIRDSMRRTKRYELERAVNEIRNQLLSAPLFATYQRGFEWGRAHIKPQLNPLVSAEQGELLIHLYTEVPPKVTFGIDSQQSEKMWLMAPNGDIASQPTALFNRELSSYCYAFERLRPLSMNDSKRCVTDNGSLNNRLVGLSKAVINSEQLTQELAKLLSFYSVIEHD